MASGFFALFDDIATLMDDVAVTSKVAAQKTVGILGDDLAVNAEQASGFLSSREIPVLWTITKGAFRNKLIILPIAFLLSYFAPWLITPILLLGGAYLAFEGAEKIYEVLFHHTESKHTDDLAPKSEEMLLAEEKKKIDSAIRTDFILSIEIIVIALGTVVNSPLMTQIFVVTLIALLATIGVYGIVALIVRMDDFGLALIRKDHAKNGLLTKIGRGLVWLLPKVIKSLGVIGTIAMLLVAGGIYLHHIHTLHTLNDYLPEILSSLLIGLGIGVIILVPILLYHRIRHQGA